MKKLAPLIKKLLYRSAEERLKIATELFRSVEPQVDPDIEKAWRKEIRKRVMEMKNGKRKFIPWSEVREALRKRVRAAA